MILYRHPGRWLNTFIVFLLLGIQNVCAEGHGKSLEDSLRMAVQHAKGGERMSAWTKLYGYYLTQDGGSRNFQCLNEWIEDARRLKDAESESIARQNKIIDFYNAAMYDSVYAEVPVAMSFCRKNKLSRKYFEAWHLLISTYHVVGKYNTALREVKRMHGEAVAASSAYGEAVAYFNMGNIYFTMGHYDESVKAFEKSLPLMDKTEENLSILLDIYPYYCDALEALKDYERLDEVTKEWWKHLERRSGTEGGIDMNASMANYYIGRTQALLGVGKLDEAKRMIDEAERLTSEDAYEWLYVLFYKAQYCLLTGQYDEAIELNAKRLLLCEEIDDKTTLIPVHRQRAEIFMAAGMYRDAALMYGRTLNLTDSLNTASSRTQLNELNTLFKVDELEMQKRLLGSWFVTIIIGLVALTLFLLFYQYRRSAKRLALKNEELAKSNDQLAEKNDELVIANAKAEESSRMKTDFIQQISHEIRTPLNILSGFTQLLVMPDMEMDAKEKQEMGHHIVENVDRITGLVNKMLELAEASSTAVIECHDEVSAAQIGEIAVSDSNIRRAEHLLFEMIEDEDVAEVMLRTNQRYAVRALGLLLDNAQKFTRQAESYSSMLDEAHVEHVWLKVHMNGGMMEFVVEDTGIGVPVEEADHIFEKFVQLDEYYDGTGIGLTVARSIARRLGGDIVLDTSYNRGARFIMTLPIDDQDPS